MTKGEALALLFSGIQKQAFNDVENYGYRRVGNKLYYIGKYELDRTDKQIVDNHYTSLNCILQYNLDEEGWYIHVPLNEQYKVG